MILNDGNRSSESLTAGAGTAYGSQWEEQSVEVLPYPLEEFQAAKPGEGSGASGATEGKEKEVVEAVTLIPFPSPVP